MFHNDWEILLVDDEPDVLSVSTLAMQEFDVYGLPVKLHTAESKAQAIEFLGSRPGIQLGLAVAFIDVVMETDAAGLELCQYMREEMGNQLTQLFIRTGQPGIAPERAVIDRYDINGYFTKVEATEDKLYSLVKSGVRQHMSSRLNFMFQRLLHSVIVASDSRDKIAESIQRGMGGIRAGVDATPAARPDMPTYIRAGGRVIYTRDVDEERGGDLVSQLDQLDGTALSPDGDKYARDGDNYQFVKIAAQSDRAETIFLYRTPFTPPNYIVSMLHQYLTDLAILWQRAS